MIRHTGSARDPLPPGGYADEQGSSRSPARWIILAAALGALATAIVCEGGSILGSGVTAHFAGGFSPKG